LLLSLGEFGQQTLTVSERDSLVEKLRVLYRNEPDPGLHAAVEWLLHQWKQDKWLKHLEQEWANDKQQTEQRLQSIGKGLATGKAEPQWYVTSQGQTMVIIPGPVEFLMGSPPSESQRSNDEQLHLKRIGRTFAIAAKAVTVEQFLRFRKGYDRLIPRFAPTADCPVHGTTWYDAAEYCNWLSKQEGLPEKQWCYEPNQDGKYEEGMKMPPDYVKRSGYRLPTNSEWEYACRAGAVTSRYYGQSEELLAKYGWCLRSSRSRSWPVGSLKPNDLGLFDMHGNVWAWCQDRNTSYALGQGGKAMDDKGDVSPPLDKEPRVLRGGGFAAEPEDLRSAKRNIYQPGYRSYGASFRPARTFDDKRQGTERAEEPRRPVLDYVAELKSFGAEKLTEGACPRWSPDGKKIVFSQVPDGAGTGLYDLETRKGTTLVRPGKDAAWSPAPNGPIASVRGEGEKEEIWLMEASGANPRKVADGGFPSWGSAGKTLFFHSRTLGRVMALRLPEPKLTAPDSGPRLDAWYPVISPDESKIAAAGGQWLRVLELKSGKILKEWPTDWGGGVVGWSPDSKWVGFGGFGHEDDGLWLLHLDEDKAYRVLPGPCTCPAWSPDGQQIAFDMRTAEGNSIWYIKSALIYQRHAAEAKKDRPAEDDHGVTTRSGPPLNP
jgi:formylglycine-generating enzyme required for sulfatase activity